MGGRDLRELAAIFGGGMVGAVIRVWISRRWVTGDAAWPWAVFLVNVGGSVVLAYAVTRLQERLPPTTYRRPFLGTGFCGALTTFSTMELELVTLVDHHRVPLAIGYAVASLAAGYIAIWVTTALVRRSRTLA